MIKVSLVAVVFFILGVFAAKLYNDQAASPHASLVEQVDPRSMSTLAHLEPENQPSTPEHLASGSPSFKSTKVDLSLFKTPKTPFEFFEVLASLKAASAEDLKEYISSLGRDKVEARRQVTWLLAGKYPNEALDFLVALISHGDLDLAKLVLQCVGQNHARLAWDWVKANENEMDKMFSGNVASKYEFKLFILNWLALVPEQKWIAYEEVQTLTTNGPRKADKYNVLSVAINAATSDPDDAINRSMSGGSGARDPMLFNGAVSVIIEKDLSKAKELVLQNQDLAEDSSVSKVAYNLMENNRFSEAYSFVNSLTRPELKSSAIGAVSERAVVNGLERSKEFANAISSDDLRAETVNGMVIKMAVSGQPIIDQVALLDSTLQKIPTDKKAFSYAYAMRDWPKNNPSEFNIYMNGLRSRDKPLADAVDQNFKYLPNK